MAADELGKGAGGSRGRRRRGPAPVRGWIEEGAGGGRGSGAVVRGALRRRSGPARDGALGCLAGGRGPGRHAVEVSGAAVDGRRRGRWRRRSGVPRLGWRSGEGGGRRREEKNRKYSFSSFFKVDDATGSFFFPSA
jgi:hypothetical protein